MTLLKGFVAVAVLAAFLAGSMITTYIRPQPAAAMAAPELRAVPASQPQFYQAEPAQYVRQAPAVRYISERRAYPRYASERYEPVRSSVVRNSSVHNRRTLKKEALIVGGGAAAGAAIGAAAHGGRGAAVGALAGGIAGLAYDLATRNH